MATFGGRFEPKFRNSVHGFAEPGFSLPKGLLGLPGFFLVDLLPLLISSLLPKVQEGSATNCREVSPGSVLNVLKVRKV